MSLDSTFHIGLDSMLHIPLARSTAAYMRRHQALRTHNVFYPWTITPVLLQAVPCLEEVIVDSTAAAKPLFDNTFDAVKPICASVGSCLGMKAISDALCCFPGRFYHMLVTQWR